MGQRKIEILILLFTFILIISVSTIGTITFDNLKVIEKQSEKIYQPNNTVIHLKTLLAELRNAENCIKSYRLYNSSEYLAAYQDALEQVDICFASLYAYQTDNDEMTDLLDSTESLVEQKVLLLNRQLTMNNEQEVVDEVNKIITKLNKVRQVDTVILTKKPAEPLMYGNDEPEAAVMPPPEKKKNFFSRLFHRKEPKPLAVKNETAETEAENAMPAPAYDSVHVFLNKGSIEEVKTVVTRVKKNQTSLFSKMKEDEMKLIEEDKMIWAKLISIFNILETKQHNLIKAMAADNMMQSNKTHHLTKTFGILIMFMLCFLALFSLYYFHTGRVHREQLNKAAEESRTLARAREIFLANMSHEMRTPLNAITGFTEQLQSSPLNEEQKKQIDIVNSASRHLLNLINDVLDLSKIEADKIQFEQIAFNPVEEIRESAELLRPKAAYKNIETNVIIGPDIPSSIIGDPLRLRQVILNLLSNSIKFTDKGTINLLVSALKDNQNHSEKINLCVSVTDTGIGISKDMLDKIFDNFTQADTSIARKYGGTGLGLSITKKIVELQGGEIHIESELYKGTKISFRIPYPVNYSDVSKEPESQENYVPVNAKGKKVLIADDELFNRILLITILKRWEIEYDEARNGKEVLEKVSTGKYDLILMDVRMPEVSGIDAARQIREMKHNRNCATPIVALTAVTSSEKRDLCLAAGMNDLITKPYNEKELIKLIENIFIKQNGRPRMNGSSKRMDKAPEI
jgi:signal transduction histidine kinase/FixJ family two-component response regulator/CHASE3 domain sensor protein